MGDESDGLAGHSTAQLFALYRAILKELRSRGVVRTENAPAGDYAEYLVARALGGRLAPNSEKSYDVIAADGVRVQVKSRVVSDPPRSGQLQLSPFRSFDFDEAVIILFDDRDYHVRQATRLPVDAVRSVAVHNQHVNGHLAHARPGLMTGPGTTDITSLLRAAAHESGEFGGHQTDGGDVHSPRVVPADLPRSIATTPGERQSRRPARRTMQFYVNGRPQPPGRETLGWVAQHPAKMPVVELRALICTTNDIDDPDNEPWSLSLPSGHRLEARPID